MKTTRFKKSRVRLERPKKQYELSACALYKLRGMGELLRILRWEGTRAELEVLPELDGMYTTWEEDGREIESAARPLKRVQARIAVLLRRVIPPNYRYSGIRGKSSIKNALRHTACHPSVKIDLRQFYPSTKFSHVRRFFSERMRCSGDVSFLLAKLCCFNGHLPTGGIHSEVVAFYCHKPQFDQLNNRAERIGGEFTTYIDDMMLTGPCVGASDLKFARRIFARAGATVHPKKSRTIPKANPKCITGVIVKAGKIEAPKSLHLKIKKAHAALATMNDLAERKHQVQRLLGYLDHLAAIEPRYRPRAKGTRAQFKNLLAMEFPELRPSA